MAVAVCVCERECLFVCVSDADENLNVLGSVEIEVAEVTSVALVVYPHSTIRFDFDFQAIDWLVIVGCFCVVFHDS